MARDANDIARERGAAGLRDAWDNAKVFRLADLNTEAVEHLNEAEIAAAALTDDLEIISAATFGGKPVPSREWVIGNLIPHRGVAIVGGDGGVGKSTLGLQLGASCVTGKQWLGFDTMPGPAIFFGAEDELDELHRRVELIRGSLGLSWGDLKELHLVPLADKDAILGTFDKNHILKRTRLLDQLVQGIRQHQPVICILDTLADIFGGNEIDRLQVRQFVALLRSIALRESCTIVVLAHPSLSGMASGSGSSGSTAWHNSVRSRLYLTYTETDTNGDPLDPDARFLHVKKLNYGPKGNRIRLRWSDGVFVPEPKAADHAILLEAEAMFLQLLDTYASEGRYVSASPSPTYAPAMFAQDPRAGKFKKPQLALAMNSLFEKKEITTETYGRPSKERTRIARTEAT